MYRFVPVGYKKKKMNFVQGICFNNSPGGSGENGSSTPELGSMAAAGGSGDPDPGGKPPKKDDCNCELYKEKEQNAAEYLKKAELDYHDRGLCKTDSCTPMSHEHQIDHNLGQIEASITNNHKYGYCEKNIPVPPTPAENLSSSTNFTSVSLGYFAGKAADAVCKKKLNKTFDEFVVDGLVFAADEASEFLSTMNNKSPD